MAFPTTNATEELPAINEILASVGQAPVTTLDQTNPDVAIAYDTLINVTREVQSEGWIFNTEEYYDLKRQISKLQGVFLSADGSTIDEDPESRVREGMRVVFELKRDASPMIVENQLYKNSVLETTFSINNVALVKGQPKRMNLLELLQVYLSHRKEIITRRTKYRLAKAEERAHIVEGLLLAIS